MRGIGEKTAAWLLTKYGSLDTALAATDLSATVRSKLEAGRDYIIAAKRVVGPVMDCAVVDGSGVLPPGAADPHVQALAKRYGIEGSVGRVLEALRSSTG